MTEYLTRRWADQPVAVMGSGTALETLRLTDAVARECGVHPAQRARVGGGGARRLVRVPARLRRGRHPAAASSSPRSAASTSRPSGSPRSSATCATPAYQVRDLKGSTAQGIGLTVSGLVHALAHEVGALIPVSARVADDICASLPCVLGPDGPSAPLWPQMTATEREAWEHSLEVLAAANKSLPI